MTRSLWSALWQLQIAITSECIWQRHWSQAWDGRYSIPYPRVDAVSHGVFQTQVRDRLFWDETLRGPKQAA